MLLSGDCLSDAEMVHSNGVLYAVRQMSHPDRMITPAEVERIVNTGEVIEEYPQDPRGPSCLLLGAGEGNRALHVVCSPKDD